MLTLVKVLVVLAWLVMVLLLVFVPAGSGEGGETVIFYVSNWGPEVEREFRKALKTLPPQSQLVIIDDGLDVRRSWMLERLNARNPGVIVIKSPELNPSCSAPADCFSNSGL